jgi:hypothetical protein
MKILREINKRIRLNTENVDLDSDVHIVVAANVSRGRGGVRARPKTEDDPGPVGKAGKPSPPDEEVTR